MTKGYKILLTDYAYFARAEKTKEQTDNGRIVTVLDVDEKTGEVRIETKKQNVEMKIILPIMICNPNYTKTPGQPDLDFDLVELGTIAKKIEQASDSVILDKEEYDKLKNRIKVLGKYLNHKYVEMLSRCINAEEVELEEKKGKN